MNKLNQAFDRVKADEGLKENTLAYLERERARRERAPRAWYRLAYSMAALVLVLGIGMYMGYALCIRSVSYLEVGTTRPVELGLNYFGTVVYAETYDSEAQFDPSEVKGKSYREAVGTLLSEQEEEGKEGLYVTVVSENGEALAEGIRSSSGNRKCHVNFYCAGDEQVEAAKACGLAVVKYDLYQRICAYEADFDLETCRSMTMKELRKYLKECETQKVHTGTENTEASQREAHHVEEEEHHENTASGEEHTERLRHEPVVHHAETEESHESGSGHSGESTGGQHGSSGGEHGSSSGGHGSSHGSGHH